MGQFGGSAVTQMIGLLTDSGEPIAFGACLPVCGAVVMADDVSLALHVGWHADRGREWPDEPPSRGRSGA